jgi:hypothetical protein
MEGGIPRGAERRVHPPPDQPHPCRAHPPASQVDTPPLFSVFTGGATSHPHSFPPPLPPPPSPNWEQGGAKPHWLCAYERYGALWRRLAQLAALPLAEGDLLRERELARLEPVLSELEEANWAVRVPIQLAMLGLRDPADVAEACDANSREQVLRFLAWVAEEERALEQAGDSALLAGGDACERLLQSLAWLAVDRPSEGRATQGRDRSRVVLRENFSAEPTLAAALAAADALYAAGPDPAALREAADRAERGGGGELVGRLAAHVRAALADPALARRRAKYNMKAVVNLGKGLGEWRPGDGGAGTGAEAGDSTGVRQAKQLRLVWQRLAELVLAPDIAAVSDQRMCAGGIEAERACIFDEARALAGLRPRGWGWGYRVLLLERETDGLLFRGWEDRGGTGGGVLC